MRADEMTDLFQLKVSLTKHGAHKVAQLLIAFPTDQVLGNTSGTYRNITINRAQAEKNLSVDNRGNLPGFWESARQLGYAEVEGLVLLGIVFSHHQLIEAMRVGQAGPMQGTILRGEIITGKAFTNMANNIEELGFSVQHTPELVSYDLRPLLLNPALSGPVASLLESKLASAGWDHRRGLADECVWLGLNEAVAMEPAEFHDWLIGNPPNPYLFVGEEVEGNMVGAFAFRAGHTPRAEGEIDLGSRTVPSRARLLHNELQSKLYNTLAMVYGRSVVGTENVSPTGSIDLVLSEDTGLTFYELKTETSIRAAIRSALPQLLEYAYWPDETRARKLVIVSPNPCTESAKRYMLFLRDKFNVPIYYQSIDPLSGALSDLC
jgi:hypothetical protein